MGGELLLGLDLGSSRVRALVVEPEGRVVGRAWRPLPASFPRPGRVEQDPGMLVERSLEVLREALARAGRTAADAAALGIATQRATVLAWDAEDGRPLAPAVGWQDQRGAEVAELLRERGLPPLLQASLPKLAWWLEREPAVRRAAEAGRLRVGTPDAWLARRLAADPVHVTDPGQASCTALWDLAGERWAAPLLERLGLGAEALPEVTASAGVVGETTAALLGAPVPLAARAGDQQAATFAQGVHRPGEAKLTLGTGALMEVHAGASPGGAGPGFPLALWRLPGGTRAFCREGNVATAGAAVEWMVSLGLFADPAALAAAAAAAPGTGGVAFVPALQGLGTPFLDGGARGFVGGLTRGSSRGELARALLEGVAQRCADVGEALGVGEGPLRVDGGLARSDLLVQRVADLLRVPVERAAEAEASALGAAWLAGLGAGLLPDADWCRTRRPAARRFEPRGSAEAAARERAAWARLVAERVRSAP